MQKYEILIYNYNLKLESKKISIILGIIEASSN